MSEEDEGEMGELKRQYAPQITTIKDMFPSWTPEDIVFALQETNGDLESTIDRITEGMRLYHFNFGQPSVANRVCRHYFAMG